ncbi:hypothetical protein [Streptomyces sp. NPDC003480]
MREHRRPRFFAPRLREARPNPAVCPPGSVRSTGDFGYPGGYSATNPYAPAIAGTSLHLDADGNTVGETAWKSTGGGLSCFEPRPAYQDGVQ